MTRQGTITAADAIYQLQSLRAHCQSMADGEADEPDSIWRHDVAALEAGITALEISSYTTYGGEQKTMAEQGKADACRHEMEVN